MWPLRPSLRPAKIAGFSIAMKGVTGCRQMRSFLSSQLDLLQQFLEA
jgi:hypothetical protein